MNVIDLENRTAIVTGGARGIGLAVVQRLLASGATVTLWDLDGAALDRAAAALKGRRVYTATVDVTDDAAIARAVTAALRELGQIGILFNNAGITGGQAPQGGVSPGLLARGLRSYFVRPIRLLPR